MRLMALAGVAFLVRLWVLAHLPVIETDGVQYVAIARQFEATGNPFDPFFPPLYPAGIALAHRLVGDYELAGRLVSAVFGTALVPAGAALAGAVLGPATTIPTGVLLALHPGLVRSSSAVLCEATYGFFVVLGVWAAWRGLTGSRPWLLPVAGGLFGLAYLGRPEGVLYLPTLLLLAPLLGVERQATRARLAWGGAGLAVFLVVAAAYLIHVRQTLGYWTLSGKVAHNLRLDLGLAGGDPPGIVATVLAHPALVARHLAENGFLFEKYALPELLPGVLALFVLPGILAGLRKPEWRRRDAWLLAATLPPFATLAFHVEARVFLPIVPFLMPFAAAGVLAVAEWVGRPGRQARWALGLTVLVGLALVPFTFAPVLRGDPGAAVYRQAARWVQETQAPDARLMDRKPFTAFYSGRPFAPLAPVTPERLAGAARDAGARLVILDSRVLDDRPSLVPLLYGAAPPGLEVVRDFHVGPRDRMRILRVVDGR